jgi:hypothetical protein
MEESFTRAPCWTLAWDTDGTFGKVDLHVFILRKPAKLSLIFSDVYRKYYRIWIIQPHMVTDL